MGQDLFQLLPYRLMVDCGLLWLRHRLALFYRLPKDTIRNLRPKRLDRKAGKSTSPA